MLNLGTINELITSTTLEALIDSGAVQSNLTRNDIEYLVYYGIFQKQVSWKDCKLLTPDGQLLSCDLSDNSNFLEVCSHCLGNQLLNVAVMHGALLLGNQSFYQGLGELPDEERKLIRMRRVSRINELYGHEQIDRLHRRNARFVNTCMMVTLSGAAVSGGLEPGPRVKLIQPMRSRRRIRTTLPKRSSIFWHRTSKRNCFRPFHLNANSLKTSS